MSAAARRRPVSAREREAVRGLLPRHVRLAFALVAAACLSACAPPPLDRAKVAGMLEATAAFQAPLDEDLRQGDPRFADPAIKRQVLKVEAVTVRSDGPFGMAGETATVSFVWQFNGGPIAGIQHRTLAKIHGDHSGWKVYEDKLAHDLRASLTGQD